MALANESDRVTNQFLWPFVEDVTRFDFEVDAEDESTFEKSFGFSQKEDVI